MLRGISMECTRSTARVTMVAESATVTGGSTNASEVTTTDLSGSWQQDIEQSIMPPMSWPQSLAEVELAGAFV